VHTETIHKLTLQSQALSYAIDMVDHAWFYNSQNYTGKKKERKEIEMKKHRKELCEMRDEIWNLRHQYEINV
jgi:hypothetical protein